MEKLFILFTRDAQIYQIKRQKAVTEENSYVLNFDDDKNLLAEKLDNLLRRNFVGLEVISAFNQFALAPAGFKDHKYGSDLISLNANVEAGKEEMMLSVNPKFGIQFYYNFPVEIYEKIKGKGIPVNFNFSGEKFLNQLQAKGGKEIHINLYHNQCEFFALNRRKVVLYNNLDISSEVDFLYFIMFTLSKINFGINETSFSVYGETKENETFISELRKFVKKLRISFDNASKKNFILS